MHEMAKVLMPLPDGPAGAETLWAARVGDNLYRLMNIPLYAYGYAEGDVVRCESRQDGWPEVVGVEHASGNLTVRICFARDAEQSRVQHVTNELKSVGCQIEQAGNGILGVTVPPTMEVPFSQMVNYLNSVDKQVVEAWEVGKGPSSLRRYD
jgi:hypothetical protein